MIDLDSIRFVGSGLSRPECVLAHESGLLFTADWGGMGGVCVINKTGAVKRIEARNINEPLRPNGIALEAGGSFLVAHMGASSGGVFRLYPDGSVEPLVTKVDGIPLPPTNYPHIDAAGRLWISVSTRKQPRALDYRPEASSGFVVLHHGGRSRLAATGLGYANECVTSPDASHLYVNETFARRLTRFPILDEGALGPAEHVATFGHGTFPDGLTFDIEGGIWVTSIVSNRVIHIAPDGREETVMEDSDTERLTEVEAAFQADQMGRSHLDTVKSRLLKNISSLAFGGSGLRRGYLGCLLGDAIATFEAPVAGAEPPHWSLPLGPLACLT